MNFDKSITGFGKSSIEIFPMKQKMYHKGEVG